MPVVRPAIAPPTFDIDRLAGAPKVPVSAGKAEPPPMAQFAQRRPAPVHAGDDARMEPVRTAGATAAGRIAAAQDPDDPLWKAAKQFEALMLGQMFEQMFSGIKTDGLFGGGQAENVYRSFLMQTYGESVSESGGVGIAEAVYRDIARTYSMKPDVES